MLFDKSLRTGKPRQTVFGGFDEKRPSSPGDNPLQARFLTYLRNAVRNIAAGKIPQQSGVERGPQRLRIGSGREEEGGISPEQLPGRPASEQDFEELLDDIRNLLKRKEAAYGLPLVAVFDDMIVGQKTKALRRKYGDRIAKKARDMVLQVIEQHAEETENLALLNLLRRLRDRSPNRNGSRSRRLFLRRKRITDR